MTAVSVAAPSKFPLWRSIGQAYAMWARNFPDLVRIVWVWILLVALVRQIWSEIWSWWVLPHIVEAQRAGESVGVFSLVTMGAAIVEQVIMLPALASVAVAWHRLLLRHERPVRGVYLRLDRIVVGYAILALWIGVIFRTPFYVIEMFLIVTGTAPVISAMPLATLVVGALAALVVATLTGLITVRLSIALPGIALGREDVRFGTAWRVSRGNTWLMLWAYFFCMVPGIVVDFMMNYWLARWLIVHQFVIALMVLRRLMSVIWIPMGMISVGMLSLAYRHFFEDDEVSSACPRGKAGEALSRLREIMGKLKQTVNEEKTGIGKVGEGE